MFDCSTSGVNCWRILRKEPHSLSNTVQILKDTVYSYKVSLSWQRKLSPYRHKQVMNSANIRSFALYSRFQEPNIARFVSLLMLFHSLWIDFRALISNSSSSSCIRIADVDIRVLKHDYFYERTLVMPKLRSELRKCLTNIRSNATSILHSKYYLTCALLHGNSFEKRLVRIFPHSPGTAP